MRLLMALSQLTAYLLDLSHSMWDVIIMLKVADEFRLVYAYDLLDNKWAAAP